MKKFMTIALVALLAVTSVFAGFSGSISTSYTADFDKESYGFTNGDPAFGLKFNTSTLGSANEGDVYAVLAGEFGLDTLDGSDVLSASFNLTEASINGKDWKVDISGAAGVENYASGFYARTKGTKSATPQLNAEIKTAPGLTATFLGGWLVSAGMDFTPATAATTEDVAVVVGKTQLTAANINTIIDADGEHYDEDLIGQVVDSYVIFKDVPVAGSPASKAISANFGMKELAFLDDALKLDAYVGTTVTGKKAAQVGLGAKVAYAKDAFSAKAGTDVVLAIADDDVKVDADVRASVKYDFVSADVYYATNALAKKVGYKAENLLDVQVKADLKSLELPVSFYVAGLDLVNDSRSLAFGVNGEVAKVALGADAKLSLSDSLAWSLKTSVGYTFEDIAALSAAVSFKGNKADALSTLGLEVAAENTTLISGAKLGLSYVAENYLAEEATIGALTASVGIEF